MILLIQPQQATQIKLSKIRGTKIKIFFTKIILREVMKKEVKVIADRGESITLRTKK